MRPELIQESFDVADKLGIVLIGEREKKLGSSPLTIDQINSLEDEILEMMEDGKFAFQSKGMGVLNRIKTYREEHNLIRDEALN